MLIPPILRRAASIGHSTWSIPGFSEMDVQAEDRSRNNPDWARQATLLRTGSLAKGTAAENQTGVADALLTLATLHQLLCVYPFLSPSIPVPCQCRAASRLDLTAPKDKIQPGLSIRLPDCGASLIRPPMGRRPTGLTRPQATPLPSNTLSPATCVPSTYRVHQQQSSRGFQTRQPTTSLSRTNTTGGLPADTGMPLSTPANKTTKCPILRLQQPAHSPIPGTIKTHATQPPDCLYTPSESLRGIYRERGVPKTTVLPTPPFVVQATCQRDMCGSPLRLLVQGRCSLPRSAGQRWKRSGSIWRAFTTT